MLRKIPTSSNWVANKTLNFKDAVVKLVKMQK